MRTTSPPRAWSRAGGARNGRGVVNPPVWRASTHLYADGADLRERARPNEDGQFYYGRRGAPTQWALAEALTELEPGAAGTVLYPSGRGGDRRRAAGGARSRATSC